MRKYASRIKDIAIELTNFTVHYILYPITLVVTATLPLWMPFIIGKLAYICSARLYGQSMEISWIASVVSIISVAIFSQFMIDNRKPFGFGPKHPYILMIYRATQAVSIIVSLTLYMIIPIISHISYMI